MRFDANKNRLINMWYFRFRYDKKEKYWSGETDHTCSKR